MQLRTIVVATCILLASSLAAKPSPSTKPQRSARTMSNDFAVGPAPLWVTDAGAELDWRAGENDSVDGVDHILVDRQWRVAGAQTSYFYRSVVAITSARGLENESRLELQWNPAWENMRVHRIEVRRGDLVIDHLDDTPFEITRREVDLDSDLIDGSLTAFAHIEDLRIGDVLDVAFTRTGVNPVFDGVASGTFAFEWSAPVHDARLRVLWPTTTPLFQRRHGETPAPYERPLGTHRELTWTTRDPRIIVDDDRMPDDTMLRGFVELSGDGAWNDVVRWGQRLHDVAMPARKGAPVDDVATLAASELAVWRSLPDPRDRLLAALRFTQREVRYVGIEVGEQSHRPRPPALVLRRRFGDCKDKSLLLVELLRLLDVEAWTAMVNTSASTSLDELLPSRRVFNHVIVAAQIGADLVWVDPTLSEERSLENPWYRRALVVRDGETGLRDIPLPARDAPSEDVLEQWQLHDGESASLVVTTTSRGTAADAARRRLEGSSRTESLNRFLAYYEGRYEGIRSAGPLAIDDDLAANVVRVVERYELDNAWTTEGDERRLQFELTAVEEMLAVPRVRRRRAPFAVVFPAHTHHRIEVESGRPWNITPRTTTVDNDAFRAERIISVDGKRFTLDMTYRSKRDRVDADSAAITAFVADVEAASAASSYLIRRDAPDAAPVDETTTPNILVIIIAVLTALLTSIVGVLVWRRLGDAPMPPVPPLAPEGRGGWLIVVGLVVVARIFVMPISVWPNLGVYTVERFADFQLPGAEHAPLTAVIVTGEAILNTAMYVVAFFVVFAFFGRRRQFRSFFVFATMLAVAGEAADEVAVRLLIGDDSDPVPLGRWLWALALSSYVLRSARVTATFRR